MRTLSYIFALFLSVFFFPRLIRQTVHKLKAVRSLGADYQQTRMWANAQRDGRPAEYRWRPLFNAAKFG